jgi:membrane protease YdiL (CAAX protease family)
MHAFGANSVGLLQIMIGAVVLTALYRKTGSLIAPILLHLTLNGIIWYHMLSH